MLRGVPLLSVALVIKSGEDRHSCLSPHLFSRYADKKQKTSTSLGNGWGCIFCDLQIKGRFPDTDEILIVLERVKSGHQRFYSLIAVQVMSNHVHVMLLPMPDFSVSRILKGIKGVSARLINEYRNSTGSIWAEESFDRIVRSQRDFDEKLNYMYENPLKAGIIDQPEDYLGWYLQQ